VLITQAISVSVMTSEMFRVSIASIESIFL
jgi:hypothetical protein